MAVDERRRHEMYLSLERAIGREGADTLMELVPPVGWADVATKQDLTALEERVGLRFEKVASDLAGLEARLVGSLGETRAEISDKLRKQTITMMTTFLTVVGVVVGAAGIVVAAAAG